jgi:hypothetical protein
MITAATPSTEKKQARVLYDYDAADNTELSLLADEVRNVYVFTHVQQKCAKICKTHFCMLFSIKGNNSYLSSLLNTLS